MSYAYDLEFEQPLRALAKEVQVLIADGNAPEHRLQDLKKELQTRAQELYAHLTAWQTVQIARHKHRPHTLDYIHGLFDDFLELHGDRSYADDLALIGGLATFEGQTVVCLGHQKGRDAKDQQRHNFGMPHPEGYRKASRLMKMAARFRFPLICFIDTPGAFPGLGDEERGQAQAIAENLALMARLPVPIISVVIGEGGSGGALAIGVADRLLMQEYSIYTVASPEAAASILWRDNGCAPQAAEMMRIRAREVLAMRIIDEIVQEPSGGAHHDPRLAISYLRYTLKKQFADLLCSAPDSLIEKRYQKFRTVGGVYCR